jgi:hypothetical protein
MTFSAGFAGDEQSLKSYSANLKEVNWTLCWKAWLNIGTQKTKYIANTAESTSSHCQFLLTGFIQIFSSLFPFIEADFRNSDAEALGNVLLSCVQIPIDNDMEGPNVLSPVHSAAMEVVKKTESLALGDSPNLIPEIFSVYFKFANASFKPRAERDGNGKFRERISTLGECAAEHIGDFFLASSKQDVTNGGKNLLLDKILFRIVEVTSYIHAARARAHHLYAKLFLLQVLKTPLKQKYSCFRQSNWRVAINVLIKVLKEGIPLVRNISNSSETFSNFWKELSVVLEHFLFPESIQDQRQEDRMADEAVDCHIIDLLRDEVLPYPTSVPPEFIRKIVILLNKGSIHSSIQLSEDCSGSVGLREDLAKQCFETLLDFSLLRNETLGAEETLTDSALVESSLTNKLAITSLLQRFKEVLVDAIDGEKLNRNIPLQRQKSAEIAFVLRAIATVISSMKRASQLKVDKKTWQQVISLYPYLVQCTETTSMQVSSSVKDALMEYWSLLQPMDK